MPANKKQLEILENLEQVADIKTAEIPELIDGQIKELEKLDKKLQLLKEEVKVARSTAERARDIEPGVYASAREFITSSVPFFDTVPGGDTAAIKGLQENALRVNDVTKSLSEAQALQFDLQKKIAKATQFLFIISAGNLAATEKCIGHLKERLSGTSSEKMGELAKNELMNVFRRLMQQRDIFMRQERQAEELNKQKGQIKAVYSDIAGLESRTTELDTEIDRQAEIDKEHDRLIAETKNVNDLQEAELKRQAQVDEEHHRLIAEQEEHYKQLDHAVTSLEENLRNQENNLNEIHVNIKDLHESIALLRQNNSDLVGQIQENKRKSNQIIWTGLVVNLVLLIILAIYTVIYK